MDSKEKRTTLHLDVLGLFLAGLINTFLALLDGGIILRPGTVAGQLDLLLRTIWISEHTLRWQAGSSGSPLRSASPGVITPLADIWTLLAHGAPWQSA
jgi:hypothetical protein